MERDFWCNVERNKEGFRSFRKRSEGLGVFRSVGEIKRSVKKPGKCPNDGQPTNVLPVHTQQDQSKMEVVYKTPQ